MIFVTVGLMVGFERLIKKMDEIAGEIDEKVVMQIGHTRYQPKNAEYFTFKDDVKEIKQMYNEARLIVSHAGVGSILSSSEFNKPLIIVPRMKKYGEHIDDHQLEIAKELENDERINVIYDTEELKSAIENDNTFLSKDIEETTILVKHLSEYLTGLEMK